MNTKITSQRLGEVVEYTFIRLDRQGREMPETRHATIVSMCINWQDKKAPSYYHLSDGMRLGDVKAIEQYNEQYNSRINTCGMIDITTMVY